MHGRLRHDGLRHDGQQHVGQHVGRYTYARRHEVAAAGVQRHVRPCSGKAGLLHAVGDEHERERDERQRQEEAKGLRHRIASWLPAGRRKSMLLEDKYMLGDVGSGKASCGSELRQLSAC